MAKPKFFTVGHFSPSSGQLFDPKGPYTVYSATNFGTENREYAPYLGFAESLARSYAEYDDEGLQTDIIQIWDQHNRLAVDMRRANANAFNVTYHPDFTFRFS